MNRYILGLIVILFLVGCKSTPSGENKRLALSESEFLSKKWEYLEHIPPLYPIEDARAGKEGCASVEYVITPIYEIKDIKVTSSSGKYFAKQAELNVKTWKWSTLPKEHLEEPIKMSTKFQFCLETGDGHCSNKNSFDSNQCAAEEVIYVTGYKIKHRE